MGDFVGPNGNVANENGFNIFTFVLSTSKTALVLAWIVLPILYYVFYYKSDVPDLIHILKSNKDAFDKCFNITIVKNNINDIFIIIKKFMDGVPRF